MELSDQATREQQPSLDINGRDGEEDRGLDRVRDERGSHSTIHFDQVQPQPDHSAVEAGDQTYGDFSRP